MPYSLFPQVEREAMSRASGSLGIGEPGAFEGFARGTGMYAMKSFADTARAIDLAGSVGPIVLDKLTGGTARQDQYFAEHDEVFNQAVDHWTPKPGEVGAAGQIVGSLAGGLPLVIASPALAVAATQLSAGEDLVRQGVDASIAGTVGAIQGASLAVGIRLPFLGKSLGSRMATGAGGNLAQGIAGAAASHAVLDAAGNKVQAEQFNPWDPTQRSLDVLMGIAFGGLAHLDAKARIARRDLLDQSAKDAILTLNQAKHLESVATPGAPEMPEHLTRRVNAMQQAIDQVLRGEPVTAERLTSDLKVTADPARATYEAEAVDVGSRVAAEILPDAQAPIRGADVVDLTTGARKTAEIDAQIKDLTDNRAQTIADTAKDLQVQQGLKAREAKKQAQALYDAKLAELTAARQPNAQEPVKAAIPAADAGAPAEAGGAAGAGKAQGAEAKSVDPVVDTANRIAAERPDMLIPTGELDANGKAVAMSAADYMAHAAETARLTQADAGLFKTAITCLLGVL